MYSSDTHCHVFHLSLSLSRSHTHQSSTGNKNGGFTLVDFTIPTRDVPISHLPTEAPLCNDVSCTPHLATAEDTPLQSVMSGA